MCRHPPGNVSMCHSWGATARAHVQGNDVPDLENSWTDCAQTWYIDGDQLVGWRTKVNWDLPCTCSTCRMTVPDLKNGWTDCAQIWYTDRDQLVGCRESQLKAPSRSSARGELNLLLARLSPPKGVLLVYYVVHDLEQPIVRSLVFSKKNVLERCSLFDGGYFKVRWHFFLFLDKHFKKRARTKLGNSPACFSFKRITFLV